MTEFRQPVRSETGLHTMLEQYEVRMAAKRRDVDRFLKAALKRCVLFDGLSPDQLQRMVDAMEPRELRPREVLVRAQGVRRGGAAAMDFCHIASGRGDGYYEFHLSPWDCAAGVLLVEEAGGLVTTVGGAQMDLDQPEVLCTNGRIHDELSRALLPLLSSPSV